MKVFLIALLLQSMPLPPRVALENPAAVSPIPPKIQKDYDKLWSQFLTTKDDTKLVKELDKLLKKQKNFDPALIIRAYLELQKGNEPLAVQKFEEVLANNPNHRIAQYYLAELMFARGDYLRANSLYSQLLAVDKSRMDVEMKRQKSLLMATENLLRSAARAEQENRLAEAEGFYRQSMRLAPNEPLLHARLADLLEKSKKPEEAAAERKIADALTPRRAGTSAGTDESKVSELEDLGRWGTEIESFREIKSAEAITRSQLATLIIRYFPHVTEFRQNPQIVTDISESKARLEIQTVVGLGLIDPLPNHTFDPSSQITRGDFAIAMARLIRLLGLSTASTPVAPLPDLAPASAQYRDAQLVLGYGLLNLEDPGSFNVGGDVSGKEAVAAAERLLRSFQQLSR